MSTDIVEDVGSPEESEPELPVFQEPRLPEFMRARRTTQS